MKKLIALFAVFALAATLFGMGKCPLRGASQESCGSETIKQAECTDKTVCKDASGTCEEKPKAPESDCAGGTCSLPK